MESDCRTFEGLPSKSISTILLVEQLCNDRTIVSTSKVACLFLKDGPVGHCSGRMAKDKHQVEQGILGLIQSLQHMFHECTTNSSLFWNNVRHSDKKWCCDQQSQMDQNWHQRESQGNAVRRVFIVMNKGGES